MYGVICIGPDGKYVRATSKPFPTAEDGRTYKETLDKSREPIMVPDHLVELAIQYNNERLEKESK